MEEEPDETDSEYPSDDFKDVWEFETIYEVGDEDALIEHGAFVPKSPFSELETIHDNLRQAIEEARNRDKGPKDMVLLTQRERVLLLEFFTVSHSLIEEWSVTLLQSSLLGSEHQSQDYSDLIFKKWMNQSRRERLLLEIGVIDEGLKGELKQVRNTRNKLVHEQSARLYLDDPEKQLANIDRALRSAKRLKNIAQETSGWADF